MATQHNFVATERMYKTRISQWQLSKNIKSHDMETLLRNFQEGKDDATALQLDGKIVPRSRVERFARKHKRDLGRARSTSATSPEKSNTPSESISQGWKLLSITEQDIDNSPESANNEREIDTSIGPLDSILRLSMPPLPLLPRPILTETFVESPGQDVSPIAQVMSDVPMAGGLIGEDFQQEQLKIPSAPLIRSRDLHTVMQNDTFQQCLLLALILTAMAKNVPFGDLSVARLDVLESEAFFDTDILKTIVDLVNWLQLDRKVILLSVVYLCRFDSSPTFRHSHDTLQQLIVALKLAQNYTHDEPYSAKVWSRALRAVSQIWTGQGYLEGRVLGDEFICLHVQPGEWKILETRLCHISTSLLVWFDQGKFTSDAAGRPLTNRFDLYR
jgi:hypothetical protein